MEIILKNIDETEAFAKSLTNLVSVLKNDDKAVVVAIHGDLGAGKTTLVQFVAKELGVEDRLQSPTFVIQKNYSISKGDFKKLVHIDAYRIENPEEFRMLKLEDTLKEKDNLIMVEWPKQGGEFFKDSSLEVFLEFVDENIRKVRLQKNEN